MSRCRSDVSNTVPLADANNVVKRAAAAATKTKGPQVNEGSLQGQCLSPPTSYYVDTDQVQQYWCRTATVVNGTVVDGEYNEGEPRQLDDVYCWCSVVEQSATRHYRM